MEPFPPIVLVGCLDGGAGRVAQGRGGGRSRGATGGSRPSGWRSRGDGILLSPDEVLTSRRLSPHSSMGGPRHDSQGVGWAGSNQPCASRPPDPKVARATHEIGVYGVVPCRSVSSCARVCRPVVSKM
jgi:hypothetical protein